MLRKILVALSAIASLAAASGAAAAITELQVTIGPRVLHAAESREVVGKKFNNGTVAVMAGSLASKQKTVDGVSWTFLDTKLTNGGLHRTEVLSNGAAVEYQAGPLVYNGGGVWYTQYDLQSSLSSPSTGPESWPNYVVSGLPGDGGEKNWEVHASFMHNDAIYLTVKRPVYRTALWRGQPVTAKFFESYLARLVPGGMSSFEFWGTIATAAQVSTAIGNRPVVALRTDKDVIPMYEADNPRCVGINGTLRIVCAVRTSADDDDETRPMDRAHIFVADAPVLGDAYEVIRGDEVQGAPYSPALDPNRQYKGGAAPIPPLLVVTSDDNGRTFTNPRFIADRGGIDASLAYDPANGVLVIAYAGLTYPRKGIAIQYSTDQGTEWSAPIYVADEEGFTDGNVFVAHTPDHRVAAGVGLGQFTLVYSVSQKYLTRQRQQWKSYRRVITLQ